VDFSEFLIHRFSPSFDWQNFEHSFFGEGRGQGPSELSRVLDFKIVKDEICLADEGTGSIKVYSTDGTYKRRNVPNNQVLPRRMILQEGRIIIESLNLSDPLFFAYDLSGNTISSFGEPFYRINRELCLSG
jgi:hypothetical protein